MSNLFDVLAERTRRVCATMQEQEEVRQANALEDAARQADWENTQTIENKELPPMLADDCGVTP